MIESRVNEFSYHKKNVNVQIIYQLISKGWYVTKGLNDLNADSVFLLRSQIYNLLGGNNMLDFTSGQWK